MSPDSGIQYQNLSAQAVQPQQHTQGGRSFRPVMDFELGTKRARCVARIIRAGKVEGTGFLLAGNWLMTNNHVLPDAGSAGDPQTTAQFNYQLNEAGDFPDPAQFHLDPAAGFHTSPFKDGEDWTVVRLRANSKGDANSQFGFVPLGEVEAGKDDAVHIIQHPEGAPKVFSSGRVTHAQAGPNRVAYDVETLGGSSGAPVFNSGWRVVALHHAELGRDPVTGERKQLNQGIHIGAVVAGLKAAGVWPLADSRQTRRRLAHDSGPMSPASEWYVTREVDAQVLDYFRNDGISAALRGGTQMGKTSLALRTCDALRMDGWLVVKLDVRDDFSEADFATGHAFLTRLAQKIVEDLKTPDRALAAFQAERSGSAFRDFINRLRKDLPGRQLLLLLDHVDILAASPACSVAVSGLRSCHNDQSGLGRDGWVRFLLLHTITPRQVGRDGSIFKVAEPIAISDFSVPELEKLVARHDLGSVDIVRLHQILGGHPFLSRKTLNAMAEGALSFDDLVKGNNRCRKLFRNHLENLAKAFDSKLADTFRNLLEGKTLKSMGEFERLLALGVVNDTAWKLAEVRCELYRTLLPDYLP